MTIPDYQSLMAPVLRIASEGEIPASDAIVRLGNELGLTEDEKNQLKKTSGDKQTLFENRVHWAITYLNKAHLIMRPRRAYFQITDRGRTVLKDHPERVDNTVLEQFSEFREWIELGKKRVAERQKKKRESQQTARPSAWIFQANPEFFDLSGALRHLKELSWLVKQSPKQIHEGDRVFLWEAGKDAGILATAMITSEPHDQEIHPEETPFTKQPEKFAGVQLRVLLRIDDVLPERLRRADLLMHPGFQNLQVIKFANATNFSVTDEEAEGLLSVIKEVLDGTPPEIAIEQHAASVEFEDDTEDAHVWLLSPGEQARLWGDFTKEGIAALGWDGTSDLREFSTREDVQKHLHDVLPNKASVLNAGTLHRFAHVVIPGDLIFTKEGRRKIIGAGVVTSDYSYDLERDTYRHTRKVDWKKVGEWQLPDDHGMLAQNTLSNITAKQDLVNLLKGLVGWKSVEISQPPQPPRTQPRYTVDDFSEETGFENLTIDRWRSRLTRKQHAVFQGPPGTGKTFVAERLAQLLISETSGFSETVQFHPSYTYEDFMQGIRPTVVGGQLSFSLVPGRFITFCEAARHIPGSPPCVLIVDEINRANLSRVFGELMYLLEYREKAIPLSGSETPFSIPSNVYMIGTMNTADRSIALVDHALRRRFTFIHLGPEYEVLRKHLTRNSLPTDSLIRVLEAVNAAIDDRNYEVGISYFMKDGENLKGVLPDIWQGEIEPYLEEYFYDQPGKVSAFRWDTLVESDLAEWQISSEV